MLVYKAGYFCLLVQKSLLVSLPVYHRLIAGGLIQPQATTDLKHRYKYLFSSGHQMPESPIHLD